MSDRVATGVEGLDEVLHGGLLEGRAYMVSGGPGAGKSILGMHFLTAGVDAGETALYVNLEEPTADIERDAHSVGIRVEGIEFLDLSPGSDRFVQGPGSNVFATEEVETPEIKNDIVETVRAVDPDRVLVDPITRFRDLTSSGESFRTLVGGFIRFLQDRGATVLFTSHAGGEADSDLQFLCDGSLRIEHDEVRTLSVEKFRGSASAGGSHTVRISDEGMRVFPSLRPEVHETAFSAEQLSSGIEGIDALLHGGIERGTVSVVSGPTGVGKTTLGCQFMAETAARGERSVIYMFEEATETFLARSRAIGIPVDEMLETGNLAIEEIEPLALSPDEFATMVREEVEEHDAGTVMVDGIDGYRLSMKGEEDDHTRELHSLCRYLRNMGVTTLLVDTQSRLTGEVQPTEHNVSYLADNIVLLRYLELDGELRKAISVLKKRTSDFERTLREFEITGDGIGVGDPLRGLRGVLGGTPEFVGEDPTREG
jgi:circadian clock protein KaiC